MPEKNIDNFGRLWRFLLGVALLAYAIWASSWLALIFALFCFFQALFSWCVMYQIFGWNSCPIHRKDKEKEK